jgi:predicted Ser/Thr protein kinase
MSLGSSRQNMARQCPQCGAPVSAEALEGLCPACLLRQGASAETATQGGSAPFEPPDIGEIARLFPQLEIVAFIGKGGMGAVYKARQPALDRMVALKILPPQAAGGTQFTERFAREARALARLNHPNIVAVHDFGQVNGMPFFVMEFVDGLNLREMERSGKLSPREALQIVPQICEALQFAHDEGVVHRDIKPENILLDKKGRVKIADFGIAKIMGAGGPDAEAGAPAKAGETPGSSTADVRQPRLTEQGKIIGTPNYMAPEQVETPQSVDHRADIFSLGVVFYEMLTGELPLGKFAPPSSRTGGVAVDVRLDEVVLRALEREPERRYQQASQVKTAVQNITDQPRVPGANRMRGINYRSRATLFGLPLLHVATDLDPATNRPRVARGIIAVGGIAQGVLAFGGIAMGGVTFGGVSLGVLAFGGCAVGIGTLGGLAVALVMALGGLAIAPIALGGGAIGYFAQGGGAWGIHPLGANASDEAARHFFTPWAGELLAAMNFIFPALLLSMLAVVIGVPFWLQLKALTNSASSATQPFSGSPPVANPKDVGQAALASAAMIFACLAGVLGLAAICLSPHAPEALILSILASAGLGIVLGIASRGTAIGKRAMAVGFVNVAIWIGIAIVTAFAVRSAGVSACPAPSGLVGWWAAEGNAADRTGMNNGIIHGGVKFVPGKVGQAFQFDGASGYVTIPASESLNVGNGSGFTIEGWLNPADLSTPGPVLEWNDDAGNLRAHFWINVPVAIGGTGPGSIFANIVDVGGTGRGLSSPSNVLSAGKFNHVALTYSKSDGTATLYLDGNVVAVQELGVFTPGTWNQVYLGTRSTTSYFYKGLMDEMSLYNRALSPGQIQAIYRAGSAGKSPPSAGPAVTPQPPQAPAKSLDSSATFSVAATGTAPLSYQWYFSPTANLASAETWSPTLAPGEKPDFQKIMGDAKELMNRGQYEEALQREIWYFNHSRFKPGQGGVRLSFALSDWIELGRRYPKAKQALIEIRDRGTYEIKAGRGYSELFSEVQAINHELQDDDATYALFLTMRTNDPQLAGQCYIYMENSLVAKGEYQWCYDHMGDPQTRFDRIHQFLDMQLDNRRRMAENRPRTIQRTAEWNQQHGMTNMRAFSPPDTSGMLGTMATNNFVGGACQLIEILVGTGHADVAQNIRDQAVKVVDDARLHSAMEDAQTKIHAKQAEKPGAKAASQ